MSERVQEEGFAVSGCAAERGEEERLFCRFSGRGPVPHSKVGLGLAAAGTKLHTAAAGTGPKAHLRPLLACLLLSPTAGIGPSPLLTSPPPSANLQTLPAPVEGEFATALDHPTEVKGLPLSQLQVGLRLASLTAANFTISPRWENGMAGRGTGWETGQ